MARKVKYNYDETMQKIYESAVEIIDEAKPEKFTVRRVCAKAGISTGEFYQFFPTKQHLISRLIDYMENYYKYEVLPTLSGDSREKLYQLCMAYIKRITRRGADYAKLNIKYTNNGGLNYFQHLQLYRTQLFVSVCQEGIDSGIFTCGLNSEDIANAAISLCRGLSLTYTQVDGDIDILSLTEKSVNVFIKGLCS